MEGSRGKFLPGSPEVMGGALQGQDWDGYLRGAVQFADGSIVGFTSDIAINNLRRSDGVPSPTAINNQERSLNVANYFAKTYDHSLLAGTAKRLRPVVAFMTGDMLGIPRDDLAEFCVALELLHTASLIVDDLPAQDNSSKRRGVDALHVAFSEWEAQLTAIAMINNAYKLIVIADRDNGSNYELADYMSTVCGENGLCKGQGEDLRLRNKSPKDIKVDDLDRISYLKTGLAIESAIMGVVIIAGTKCPEEAKQPLLYYAYHLGIAWQVKDDIDDVRAPIKKTGKSENQDAKNKKPNYVTVLGPDEVQKKLDFHLAEAQKYVDKLESLGLNATRYREITEYVSQGSR
ncbi:hypothetical protein A3F37_03010 [Candidatus Saccharibacteria bacterium RIFCSPHIGHO2_12_FULL_41_12]|nr:MAG: hypothetical protein A3F37_03010 [Candidatus Saccharibacteria bacterium RIFCSPHIGHO2_12_FULL_41_12]